jgi:hypothetical protein
MNLLSINQDSKTIKSNKQGYLTGILYMAPNTIGGYNVCPSATAGCIQGCLYTAGRAGIFSTINQARVKRKELFFADRANFILQLRGEVIGLIAKAQREGLKPTVRLNGTSDLLPTDYIKLMHEFQQVRFYDYTKVYSRMSKNLPDNYYLTFSRSESNDNECIDVLRRGFNVAAVFQGPELPKYWHDFPVIPGDDYDVRFLDPRGVVVGLVAKGAARKDKTGFVIRKTCISE